MRGETGDGERRGDGSAQREDRAVGVQGLDIPNLYDQLKLNCLKNRMCLYLRFNFFLLTLMKALCLLDSLGKL